MVAVLTRNIRIEGEEDAGGVLFSQSFGARVLVGQLFVGGETHSGKYIGTNTRRDLFFSTIKNDSLILWGFFFSH